MPLAPGSQDAVRVAFRAGPGRLVGDGTAMHSGGVVRAGDGAYLNLHRPGTVRAVIDVPGALGRDLDRAAEVDGWSLFDAVLRRCRTARGQ
ncbi:hypothetical protein HDA32_005261 [Spinactinospora alkalitolerans]|uniref:Uncharacterized protein n=1 Tax=Spinactinospora alkalitolerans TaxID=687207 RepID=A0A852U1Z3_9ACTN|nr:hypothetical protein [Spinactinospora alkalitolerans]NYE50141.1 hypothetical protein [Spinactinospora alkalitolerans]